ncbi:VanZ family protein [Enterocloster clostridioformis]|uniref:VanZ family protein n=1 Tax=Enterocloster clostridioformis TaxID=1531 RepID=UPI0022E237B8|nr:VanZ family protein [Enterocloster clostridioformis]
MCPFISKSYKKMKNTLLIGIALSLFIEIAQLFTLHRATDINDLLTNVIGTFIGYLCSKWMLSKREGLEAYSETTPIERDCTVYVPIIIIAATSILGFFS